MTNDRQKDARKLREQAAQLAFGRTHPEHEDNGDEKLYASAHYPMSFTKGLDHDKTTGLIRNPADFQAFRKAIDNGYVDPFTTDVPVPDPDKPRRKWEAPTAGFVYDLQGPDAQAETMAAAPALDSTELIFEMAEVYELALLRDVPLCEFRANSNSTKFAKAVERLNRLAYAAKDHFNGRPRITGKLTEQTAFRGSTHGVDQGPYLSQFMLIGNSSPDGLNKPEDGYINFGAQQINQRVLEASEHDDYMMNWDDWHAVQQGFDVLDSGKCADPSPGQNFTGKRRFIYTPRDLATYVHIDALYQAYLNACLILLSQRAPFDPKFNNLSGMGDDTLPNPAGEQVKRNAGGFALWGGPHILSLVTEVATRALKAVRYQKFNTHLRLRPEALAARIEKATEMDDPKLQGLFSDMQTQLADVLTSIKAYNKDHPRGGSETALLPMAFEEGSPMHPTYGAGHATVAGACVTMLKAFFDTSARFAKRDGIAGFYSNAQIVACLEAQKPVVAGAYEAIKNDDEEIKLEFVPYTGTFIVSVENGKKVAHFSSKEEIQPLTLEGELNKLAANISLGRNMAGVHYYSDYYDSLRMGEKIAIGILEEQALGYPTDEFVVTLPTFDDKLCRIARGQTTYQNKPTQ